MPYEDARSETVPVGNSSTLISSPKPRKLLYFFNSSTGGQVLTIVLAPQPAVAGAGVVLQPNTGYMESESEGFKVYGGTINAIASAAGGQLSVMER